MNHDKENELREQRNQYMSELFQLKEKYQEDISKLHKRISEIDAGVIYPTESTAIEYMIEDLTSCLHALAPDLKDTGNFKREYGSQLGGVHSSISFVVSMLVANINYLKRTRDK